MFCREPLFGYKISAAGMFGVCILSFFVWLLGLAAVALQIVELLNLPFQPGASGYASVFTGFYPVALTIWLCAMIWLEILFMRARGIPAIFFVEQPPTYKEAFDVQRFQSSLSSFTWVWNYLAIITIIF